MARLSPATRDSVPEAQRDAFDEIIGSGSPPAVGPGSITIHVPEAGKRASALNQYLREESSLPKKIQELATPEIVEALREGGELPALAPDEQAVINYGQEFYRTHHVSSGGFQAALEQLGKQGLVELTMLMGNYALLAFLVNSFDSGLPPERTEPILSV